MSSPPLVRAAALPPLLEAALDVWHALLSPQPSGDAASPGGAAFRHCTHPSDPMSYSFCRAGWSTLFGYTLDSSAG